MPSSKDYAVGMNWWDKGYGLREPQPASEFQLGMLGYLDARGSWCPLFNVTMKDPDNDGYYLPEKDLEKDGYSLPKKIKAISTQTDTWGPKYVENVEEDSVELNAEVTTESLGLPLTAKAVWKYTTETGYGAVLFCESPVVSRRYASNHELRTWLKDNIQKLVQKHKVLKTPGL